MAEQLLLQRHSLTSGVFLRPVVEIARSSTPVRSSKPSDVAEAVRETGRDLKNVTKRGLLHRSAPAVGVLAVVRTIKENDGRLDSVEVHDSAVGFAYAYETRDRRVHLGNVALDEREELPPGLPQAMVLGVLGGFRPDARMTDTSKQYLHMLMMGCFDSQHATGEEVASDFPAILTVGAAMQDIQTAYLKSYGAPVPELPVQDLRAGS